MPVWKEAAATAASYPWFSDYVRVLERFPLLLERGWHPAPGNDAQGYLGGPEHDERAMPALTDAVLTLAVLASEPSYDARVSGTAPDRLRERALQTFRYALATHVTGSVKRPDGHSWGDQPAAGAWAVRLAIAEQALASLLTDADREALARVLAREAEAAAAREIGSRVLLDSAAPGNARDAATLAWAAAMLPKDPRAPAWEAAARERMMNTLSTPQDRRSARIVDGRPVRDWVNSENLLPEYLLEEGGAVNPDAAFATLSSLALARYGYLATGRTPPDATLHGVPEAWSALNRLWLFSERFVYPAGQVDVRQPVGPSVALTAATAAQSGGMDPSVARAVERAAFRALEWEQSQNRDGTFFGGRISGDFTGPRAALEAGAYGAVALALRMHRTAAKLIAPVAVADLQRSLEGGWISPVGEVGSARGPRAFVSFSWRSVGGGLGLTGIFAPPGGDDLVGWAPDQCGGSFDIEGIPAVRSLIHRERLIAGGFTTTGQIFEGVRDRKPVLVHGVSWTALPEAGLAVLLDLTIATQSARVTRDEGLQLALANDLFNGNRRAITCDDGRLAITGVQADAREEAQIAGSRWLNVDGRLGAVLAYGQQPFTLRDFSARDQNPTDPLHSLLYERLDCPYRTDPVEYRPGQVVRDTAVILVAGDVAATKEVSERSRVAATGQELLRAVRVVGPRGHHYLLIANFADHEQTLRIRPPGEALAPLLELRLGPLETQVIGE